MRLEYGDDSVRLLHLVWLRWLLVFFHVFDNKYTMLCCAMLCCAVLCYAMPNVINPAFDSDYNNICYHPKYGGDEMREIDRKVNIICAAPIYP
jgi:hypothetical protein